MRASADSEPAHRTDLRLAVMPRSCPARRRPARRARPVPRCPAVARRRRAGRGRARRGRRRPPGGQPPRAARPARRTRPPWPSRCPSPLPVRDEAHRSPRRSPPLLAQRGVPDLEVLVLDDGSTDGTADVVRAVADGDPRLAAAARHAAAPGLPGKPHACAQLAAAAARGSVLVFVDADVVLAPHAVAAAVARAARRRARPAVARGRASSPTAPRPGWCSRCCSGRGWCRCRCAGPSGRRARRCAPRTGSSWSSTPRRWPAAGGFAGVAGEVLDDLALARAVKRAGGRVGVADGRRLAACRMYDGWAELSAGYRKSLWAAFGPAPAVRGRRRDAGPGLRRAAAGRAARVPGRARRLRGRGGEPGAGRAAQRRPGLAGRAGPPGVGRGAAGAAGRVVARAPAGRADVEGAARSTASARRRRALTWRGSS